MTPFPKLFTEILKDISWQRLVFWAVLLLLGWSFLWLCPWQPGLQELIWVRLGVALMVLIVPGLCVYGLLADGQGHWTDHLTFGFVISHLMIAAAGTTGRLVHVSFGLIFDLFMLAGLILLILYLLPILSKGFSIQIDRASVGHIASVFSILLIAVLSGLIVIQRILSDDDLTYLAYITNWQHSARLDFSDLFFGTGQLVQPRFWLVSTPFAQAFLAEVSGLPGILLLGGYYEAFLVVLSMLCWYGLARTLHLSHQAASVAVILQILFLLLLSQYLHPGAAFFSQLSVDKATASFILAPVFIQSLVWVLRKQTKNNIILCLSAGLSLTWMHPIALAYSVFIGGVMIMLTARRNRLRTSVIPAIILVVILLPQVVLRFVPADAGETLLDGVAGIQSQTGYHNMLTVWDNTPFYGFNPSNLTMTIPYESRFPSLVPILKWGWLLIPVGAMIVSLPQLRQNNIARYVFSSFLLCTLAALPLTGWMIGYFLSPWMLERATWLFPYGLSAVFFLLAIRDRSGVGRYMQTVLKNLEIKTSLSIWPLIVVTFFSSVIILLFMREQGLPDLALFESRTQRYQDLARVGRFLDSQIPIQSAVIGSDDLNDLLPGVSRKSKIITFRTSSPANMPFFSLDIINERVSDRKTILSRSATPEVRISLLAKYDIRFLLLRRSDYDLFKNLVANYPSLFETTEIGRYIILKIG